MLGVVAERETLEPLEAADEKSRTDEHDQRERNLEGNEDAPRLPSGARRTSGSGVETERRRELAARTDQCRHDAEEKDRADGDNERDRQRSAGDGDVVDARELRRRDDEQRLDQRRRRGEAKDAAGNAEQYALHHQLPDDGA